MKWIRFSAKGNNSKVKAKMKSELDTGLSIPLPKPTAATFAHRTQSKGYDHLRSKVTLYYAFYFITSFSLLTIFLYYAFFLIMPFC